VPSPTPDLTTQRKRIKLICQIFQGPVRKLSLDPNLLFLWLSLTMQTKRRKAATRDYDRVLQLKFNSSRLALIDVALQLSLL
jgi:hypothetical protein